MAILIGTSVNKKVFDKDIITIGSTPDCDFQVNIGKEPLTLQYSKEKGKYILANSHENPKVLFKGAKFAGAIAFETALKLTIADSNDFIVIKVVNLEELKQKQPETVKPIKADSPVQILEQTPAQPYTNLHAQMNAASSRFQVQQVEEENVINFATSDIEKQKAVLEKQRSPIIKKVGFAINDIKKRISHNNKTSVIVHVAMFFSSIVTAFGVSNFITGLKIQETGDFINLPTNIKILTLFAFVVFGLCLVLKQGSFLYYQNKRYDNVGTRTAEAFHLTAAAFTFISIYVINLIYYMSVGPLFAILMSLFFVGLSVILAMSSGYLKNTGHMMSYELDKYEYREDFEVVMNNYRQWIERFINTFGQNKIENLKDKLFNLQIKSVGEIMLGIITAPFLAYGVSNTLASCFPEAAGWIRISGLRFSPIFLALATFMIIFAFFALVNAFLATRKIQASDVIKHDGFSNFITHGVNILGIQGVKKLESEQIRSMAIACSIICIEFTMNVSYFCTEIGGDLQGMLLSFIAALVPTALLIAETYMLSQTKFEADAISDLLSMKD